MNPDSFAEEEKRGLYRAIYERKDIRTYKPDSIEADVLKRILDGAHHAPSVGFMQPWNFILIENNEKKREVYNHFLEVNESSAKLFPGERNIKYKSLKLQGILDSPLNMLVTCDTRRGGENVLGRTTIKDTDIYSTCLAIQNLWLCARAEGIGVGWMSLYVPEVLSRIFSLPDYVIPVAYLTLGYAVEFPKTPILESVGWRKRLPLSEVIFFNQWGKSPLEPEKAEGAEFDAGHLLNELSAVLKNEPDDIEDKLPGINGRDYLQESFEKRNQDLTKPPGSLGKLEGLMKKICNIQGGLYPQSETRRLIIAASDHGIVEEGVSAYKKELTSKMVYQFLAGGGAISSLAREYKIGLHIVDAGVDHDFEGASGLVDLKVRRGTRNFLNEEAMTKEEFEKAVENGRKLLLKLGPTDLLGLGEMGIGNTTSSAAVSSLLLGLSPDEVTGKGTGVGSLTLQKKTEVIEKSLKKHKINIKGNSIDADTANEILRIFGGFEMALLLGVIYQAHEGIGEEKRKVPVILDGFITSISALVAVINNPLIKDILIAGHLSKEPGHRHVLDNLGLEPVIDLEMALGEGSGAAFAIGLLEGGIRIMREMKTFEEAGIENPVDLSGKK